MPPSAYPSITTTPPLKYSVPPPDYKSITVAHTYEDQGQSFNSTGDTAPQRWILEYNGLTAAQAATLDAHFASAKFTEAFSFVDRAGATQTNVRYLEYEADHIKTWVNQRRVVLVKRPA